MSIIIHPRARERMVERGASEEEVVATIGHGERFPAKMDRQEFRWNFSFDGYTATILGRVVFVPGKNKMWRRLPACNLEQAGSLLHGEKH